MFDEQRQLVGPVTRAIRRRSLLLWAAAVGIGAVLSSSGLGAHWAAFGVGLTFPGAGFLYSAHPLLMLLTLMVFVASLLAWLLIGAFVAPIIVWLGSGWLAALVVPAEPWQWARIAAPAAVLLLLLVQKLRAPAKLKQQLAVAKDLNAHLVTVPLMPVPSGFEIGPALDEQEVGAMRFMLDLALQPIDRFDGFTTIDQFREAAWRYQLYTLTESLAMLRSNRLPAFSGYLQQAQRNAIMKMTDRRVWQYWFWENLWGNGRIDPDPMVNENIMITGWYALALGAYQITTGDRSIDATGSLPFRWNDRKTYEYSYPKIADTLVRNFGNDKLCFYPCEPNWVFSYCNEEGIAGLALYDRFHGSRHAEALMPTFLKRMEQEFTCADGGQVVIMANRIGLQIATRGATLFAGNLWLRNMFAPGIAARGWAQLRHEFLRRDGGDLIPIGRADRLDTGNYQMSDGNAFYPQLMLAAKEMGDSEVYAFTKARHDALGVENNGGALRWPGSTFVNLTSHMARFGSHGAWNRLAHADYPTAWREGPLLSDVPYPAVMVTRAVSDGAALDFELLPTRAGARHQLGFSRLRANGRYRLAGAEGEPALTADPGGEASADVRLDRRTQMRLLPLN
ncbi:hypothetical protein [Hydrocarboniphaga sp.]|uniref:linalool dehydratase/isomerase domain-containing protein n=1 Tax=Hydrocarboniphaga sp. TaxID=2033016 RepID=UPI002632AA1D|nr:hypothetical protein [Hydrocarboniphaga sp.]